MTRIIMHGCNGHMGQVITGLVKEDANAEIIAGIDMNDNGQKRLPGIQKPGRMRCSGRRSR